MELTYRRTDGRDPDFRAFYLKTEEYYNRVAGGADRRRGFMPYNISESVTDVLIVLDGEKAVGCAGLKKYSDSDIEVKRVWVEPEYRRRHIAREMMTRLEAEAAKKGFRRAILQTRPVMGDAVGLYLSLGYRRIDNYPPYDKLEGAVCYARRRCGDNRPSARVKTAKDTAPGSGPPLPGAVGFLSGFTVSARGHVSAAF